MAPTTGRRLFRTVLFTDIVNSTELAAELGDRKWRRTVAAHHAAIRRELKRHHGREVDTAGDGFFAVFESPTDAMRCASAAVTATHALGLRIRAGVHTGEVEQAGAKFGGIAVHIGARLLALAAPQEVIVSNTVRELVAGSGHAFEDRGTHQLKGVPGEWHVYALALPRFEQGVPLVGVDDEELRVVAARRQRIVVAGLVAVIVLLAAGLGAAFLVLNRPPPPVRGPNTIALFDASSVDPQRTVAVDRGPADIAVGDGGLWTANIDAGTVSRVDAGTGAVTSLGQAGSRPTAVAVEDDRVWVLDRYSGRLTMFDARNSNLIGSTALHASALATADDQLWIADDLGDRLMRLDPASGATLAEISLGRVAGPTDLVFTEGSIWVAAPRSQSVLRVDPGTGAVGEVAAGLSDPRSLAAVGGDIWVLSPGEDKIARIDAGTGRVVVTVDACDTPVAIAATAGGAWVACAADRSLWRIDRGGSVTRQITLVAVPSSVAADGERVWVTLRAD